MTVIFRHGFEGGDFGNDPETGYAWTGTASVPAVVSAPFPVHHGTYSAQLTTAASDGCYYDFAEEAELYTRRYVNFSAVIDNNCYIDIGGPLFKAWGEWLAKVSVLNDAGTYKWRVTTSEGFVPVTYTHTSGPTVGAWHCVDTWFKKNTLGGVKLYIDDVLVLTGTGVTSDIGADRFYILTSTDSTGQQTYHDCVVLDDSTYIGHDSSILLTLLGIGR